jgi:hypothetical protein
MAGIGVNKNLLEAVPHPPWSEQGGLKGVVPGATQNRARTNKGKDCIEATTRRICELETENEQLKDGFVQ